MGPSRLSLSFRKAGCIESENELIWRWIIKQQLQHLEAALSHHETMNEAKQLFSRTANRGWPFWRIFADLTGGTPRPKIIYSKWVMKGVHPTVCAIWPLLLPRRYIQKEKRCYWKSKSLQGIARRSHAEKIRNRQPSWGADPNLTPDTATRRQTDTGCSLSIHAPVSI